MSPEVGLAMSLARGPLIGTFLGLFLYGATCMQAFFYYLTYYDDHRALKMMVALLVTLETIHAAMSIWLMDNYLITGYGNVSALQSANWLSVATYNLGLLIDFIVYLYFIWRIWHFTKSIVIVVLMMSISISRTGISIAASTLSVLQPTWQVYLDDYRKFLIIGNVLFILGDTISASVMAYQLNKFKNWAHAYDPKRRRPIDRLLDRLLIFVIATGALTVFVDIVALILTLAQPQSLAFLSAILVQTRLYANSLLSSLNIRKANLRAYQNAPPNNTTTNGIEPRQQPRQRQPLPPPAVSLRFARPSTSDLEHDEHDLSLISDEEEERGGRQSMQTICQRKSTAESWHTAQTDGFQV